MRLHGRLVTLACVLALTSTARSDSSSSSSSLRSSNPQDFSTSLKDTSQSLEPSSSSILSEPQPTLALTLEEERAADLYRQAKTLLNELASKDPLSLPDYYPSDASLVKNLRSYLSSLVLKLLRSSSFSAWRIGGPPPVNEADLPKPDPRVLTAQSLLEEAASLNHTDSIFTLGEMYFFSRWTCPRDFEKAFHYYKRLADDMGNATAQHRLGVMYSFGLGPAEHDQGRSLLYYTFAAAGGDQQAQMTLSYKYLYGIGVPKDCEEAVYHARDVADKAMVEFYSGPPGGKTLPRAKYRLSQEFGGAYGVEGGSKDGRGEEEALPELIEYFRYTAERGDFMGNLILGQVFYQGTPSIPANYARARKHLLDAAELVFQRDGRKRSSSSPTGSSSSKLKGKGGDKTNDALVEAAAQAAGLLGRMYYRGEGVKKDVEVARRWFLCAADEGNADGLYGLGDMYLTGANGIQDTDKAIRFLSKAASKGHADSLSTLGLMAFEARKDDEAMQWFTHAADKQDTQARYYLGEMYNEGWGAPRSCPMAISHFTSVTESLDWSYSPIPKAYNAYRAGAHQTSALLYLISGEMGYEVGQANAAWLLDQVLPEGALGLGKEEREKFTLALWTRSGNQGSGESRVKAGDGHYWGKGTEVNVVKAAELYETAATHDLNAMAMWNLGWMHEHGIGVPQDLHLAKRYYDQTLARMPDAHLPVSLSMMGLWVRWAWSWWWGEELSRPHDFLHRSTHSAHKKGKEEKDPGTEGGSKAASKGKVEEGREGEDQRAEWDIGRQGERLEEVGRRRRQEEEEGGAGEGMGTEEDERLWGGMGGDDFDETLEEGLVDSMIILLLCGLVAWMVYVRQLRVGAQAHFVGQQGQQGVQGQAGVGIFM
ncbi:MAG: hypothetical protein DHS80DRAFT_30932 [Piptocephalis tieghemiana]|nr:MAG: hypothetical protein DHS80DRAFT_30932 [Piptocephalis tieghemiana]